MHKREMNQLYPGVDIHPVKMDVGEESQVRAVVDQAIEKYGRLDVMFANAGITGVPNTFEHVTANNFMATMRVDALGVFLCFKYAALAMKKTGSEKKYPGGSIVGTGE